MVRRKRRYAEGDWFAIPLRESGYVLGHITRVSPSSDIVLGYFFRPWLDHVPVVTACPLFTASDALLIRLFGDRGLQRQEWPIIFRDPTWTRHDWPLPWFVRRDLITGIPRLIAYEDADIRYEQQDVPVTNQAIETLPSDGLSGHIALQYHLTNLLS